MANKTYKTYKLQDISLFRTLKLDDYIRAHWCRAYKGVYSDISYSPRLKPKSYELYTKSTEKWLWHLRKKMSRIYVEKRKTNLIG